MWFLKGDTVESWCWNGAFSPDECNRIRKICDKLDLEKSLIGDIRETKIDDKIRKNKVCPLPQNDDTKWIYERCTGVINLVNEKYFNYDLIAIRELQYSVYEEGEFYKKHIDTQYEAFGTRKLSFSIQLSEPDEYEGGDLLLYYTHEPTTAKKDQGIMTAFNSHTLHEVTPVTKGKRCALVGWVIGPRFK